MATLVEVDPSGAGSYGTTNSVTKRYKVLGATDENSVKSSILSWLGVEIPTSVDGGNLVLDVFNWDKDGNDVWSLEVKYVPPGTKDIKSKKEKPKVGEARGTFSIKGQEKKVGIGFDQVGVDWIGDDFAPNLNNIVGWDGENVNGTEILYPRLSFTVEYTIPAAVLTTGYLGKIFYCANKINKLAWKGFDPEQVLFLGFEGTISWEDIGSPPERLPKQIETTLTFEFEVGDQTIPDYITFEEPPIWIAKHGWDLVENFTDVSIDGGALIPAVRYTYVTRVYEKADFDIMAIPIGKVYTPYEPEEP